MRASSTDRSKLILVAIFLFLSSLFLTAYSAKNPKVGRSGLVVFQAITYPITSSASFVASSLTSFYERYVWLVRVEEENSRLASQLQGVAGLYTKLEELQKENSRLRRLLALEQAQGLSGVIAAVIGFDPSNWIEAATINRGALDGVKMEQAVVTAEGVVGQIIAVNSRTSKVLFITDRSSGVDAMLQAGRARGVLRGGGVQKALLEYVSIDEAVQVGERVVTSGLDGVYPKGILLGLVSAIEKAPDGLFHKITVRPGVDFSRLEELVVIRGQTSPLGSQALAADSSQMESQPDSSEKSVDQGAGR